MTQKYFVNRLNIFFDTLDGLENLLPFHETYPHVIIYGAGNFGKRVYEVLNRRGIKVLGFLDQKAEPGQLWNDVPIWKPRHEPLSCRDLTKTCVIVAIHNRDSEIPPTLDELRDCGFPRIVTPVELYDIFGDDLGDSYWLTSRSKYKFFRKEIFQCLDLWADEKSREIFLRTLELRLTGNYAAAPIPEETNCQYMPEDIPICNYPLRLVDCGAFDGDTLKSFFEARIPLQAVAAFEPDQTNFNQLAQFVQMNADKVPDIFLWPCGVYSSVMQARFEGGLGEAAKLSTEGNTIVQCVSLDEAIPNFAPNFIKMDVEGAEYAAILGAQRTIRKCRPNLAICVYHEPEHLWKIPLLISKLFNQDGGGTSISSISEFTASMNLKRSCMLQPDIGRYDFFLRQHGRNGLELVLYSNRKLPKV